MFLGGIDTITHSFLLIIGYRVYYGFKCPLDDMLIT